MLRQKLVQKIRPRVEREPCMPDHALLLLFLQEIPQMEPLVFLIIAVHQRMQQIVVQIIRPQPFQARLQLFFRHFLADSGRREQFACKRIALSWMTLHQRLARRFLRPRINVRRVKIGESVLQKMIRHPFEFLQIDGNALSGQPHEPESEFLFASFHLSLSFSHGSAQR